MTTQKQIGSNVAGESDTDPHVKLLSSLDDSTCEILKGCIISGFLIKQFFEINCDASPVVIMVRIGTIDHFKILVELIPEIMKHPQLTSGKLFREAGYVGKLEMMKYLNQIYPLDKDQALGKGNGALLISALRERNVEALGWVEKTFIYI